MAIKGICFVLLVMYVPISRSKTCQIRNQRYVVFIKLMTTAYIDLFYVAKCRYKQFSMNSYILMSNWHHSSGNKLSIDTSILILDMRHKRVSSTKDSPVTLESQTIKKTNEPWSSRALKEKNPNSFAKYRLGYLYV